MELREVKIETGDRMAETEAPADPGGRLHPTLLRRREAESYRDQKQVRLWRPGPSRLRAKHGILLDGADGLPIVNDRGERQNAKEQGTQWP
jgi:hypothetical protein